jgi:hypothetical protein
MSTLLKMFFLKELKVFKFNFNLVSQIYKIISFKSKQKLFNSCFNTFHSLIYSKKNKITKEILYLIEIFAFSSNVEFKTDFHMSKQAFIILFNLLTLFLQS